MREDIQVFVERLCDAAGFELDVAVEPTTTRVISAWCCRVPIAACCSGAAERVRSSRLPFTFEPMTPRERRIIRVALADKSDVRTELVGEGSDRKVRIVPV